MKIGRPPLGEDERKTEEARFRVTKAESDTLWRAAIQRRKSLSNYLRELVGFRSKKTNTPPELR